MDFKPHCYADTDSITKQAINAAYGLGVAKSRNYICVIVDDSPTIIFKDKIVSVSKSGEYADIRCVGDITFYTKNKYVDVVKMLI